MNKKFLSLVLALVMVLGTFTTVFAEEAKTEKVEKVVGKDNKIQYVIDHKFVEGYGDGDYGYDKNIKRSEITKLLVYANGDKELADKLQGTAQGLYKDVDEKYWANGVILVGSTTPSKANKQPMLNGYPDGTFKGENDVTYAELAKMLVVLVKEDLTADMIKEANKDWPAQWMTWANQLGILDDVNVTNSNAPANRADAFTMLYNALYKMVEFRRTPANDKIGVLSSLRNDKLVLNQDADKQTYTITKETVFVGAYKELDYKNVVLVSKINDPDYLLGSLVRIMVNDKNEVSHILELGNPQELAIGISGKYGADGPNSRWADVAKRTIETGFTDVGTLKDANPNTYKGYAKIVVADNKLGIDGVEFYNNNDKQFGPRLGINDDTKIYVANPANNQMRQVKNIDEAMSLIGYDQNRWNKIPNVYAGYGEDKYEASLYGYGGKKSTAKVLVFNVVAKAKGGDTYRVVMSSDSKGDAVLQDVDGKIKPQSFIKNIANFPYNYGNLYDVIELSWRTHNNNYDVIKTLIDHDDLSTYPVVRVTEPQSGDHLTVIDRFGYETTIYVGDAKIFTKPEYKDMKDKYVQFRNANENAAVTKENIEKSTEIKVLSILPNDRNVVEKFEKSDSMQNIVKGIQKGRANGEVIEGSVSDFGEYKIVKIDVQFSNWKKDVYKGIKTFIIDSKDAAKLEANYKTNGGKVQFLIEEDRYKDFPVASDFHENGPDKFLPAGTSDKVKAYEEAVNAYLDATRKEKGSDAAYAVATAGTTQNVTEKNVEHLLDLLNKVKTAEGELSGADKNLVAGKYLDGGDYKLSVEEEHKVLDSVEKVRVARAELREKIKEAKALKDSVEQSEETTAANIEKDKKVANAVAHNALNTAITAAEGVADDMTKNKSDLDTAKSNLDTAANTTFKGAIVKGTKAN